MVTGTFAYSQSWTMIEYTNTIKNYNITVSSDHTVTFFNTSPAARADQVYHNTIDNSQFNSFDNFLNSTGFLADGYNPNYMDKKGSAVNVRITLTNGKQVALNDNLGDKPDIANFNNLVTRIEALVSNQTWTDNGIKKNTVKKKRHHKKTKKVTE